MSSWRFPFCVGFSYSSPHGAKRNAGRRCRVEGLIPGFCGVYHRAGPPGPASGRPDGRLRPDPVAPSGLRTQSGPFLNQRLAVELAARALGQGFAQEDWLWRLEGRKLRRAMAQEIIRHEHFTRTQHHVAYHFLAPHCIRNADGRGLGDFVALQQDAVDLHRRNVDAAADDEVLRAAGEMQEAVGVEIADIAGVHPAATVRPRGSVVAEIAILVVVPGADLDLADFTGWKAAILRTHD